MRRSLRAIAYATAALLVLAATACGGGGNSEPTATADGMVPSATAAVVRLQVRLPSKIDVIGPDTEGLFTSDGSDLYYIGPSGRIAIQPLPMLHGPAAPVGATAKVRATAEVPQPRRTAGPYPDETLLFDADGSIYISWAGELRPVTVGRAERSKLQALPAARAPVHLVPAD